MSDYRTSAGTETIDPEALMALRGHLRILDRKLSRLLPEDPDVDEAMESLDRTCCRLRSAVIHLQHQLRARLDEREGDSDQVVKRRVPRVLKSLSEVGEGADMLRRAQAALRAGPHTYARFLQDERERLASV